MEHGARAVQGDREMKQIITAMLISFVCILHAEVTPGKLRAWKNYGKPENTTIIHSDREISVACTDISQIAGVWQLVMFDQKEAMPIMMGFECKAENVSGEDDNNFGIYMDITHTDGCNTWGVIVKARTGTHDWEQYSFTYTPQKPIRSVNFRLLLRKKTGRAQFRAPFLAEIGGGTSDVKDATLAPSAVKTVRVQPTVPEGFTQEQFREEHPLPEPTASERARGYMLFSRPITRPIYSTSVPFAHERIEILRAFAARGEYEPVTFALYPLRDIGEVTVTAGDMAGVSGVIGSKHITVRIVTEWNIRYPMYSTSTGAYRRLPELLEEAESYPLIENRCVRYWLRIAVPHDAVAGIYRGVITIRDPRNGSMELPLSLRVMNFSLERDPKKRYSAYYYGGDVDHVRDDRRMIAITNELREMLSYGIDMYPTFALVTRKNAGGDIEFMVRNSETLAAARELGFQGPIPVAGGIWDFYSRYVPNGKIGSHWRIDAMPTNDEIYTAIERSARRFREEMHALGYPELIWVPMDEVDPVAAPFAAKVYAAIRKAGVRTYITKDPTGLDSDVYRDHDAVDAWCSQPFSMPYTTAAFDRKYEYWSYPNHNAGEIKDRVVMQKGGRMTYGFGLWKSGYTTLIPWRWRWSVDKQCSDPFDYLRTRQSGCGNRIDEHGRFIPAVYWECFREGYDDARYIYTLQKAVFERETSSDPKCQAAVARAKKFLVRIWDSIEPQEKYMKELLWPDEQFTAVRYVMAVLIEELSTFAPLRSVKTPSVIIDTRVKEKEASGADAAYAQALRSGVIESVSIMEPRSTWRPQENEASVVADGGAPLRFSVRVDHKNDGSGSGGKYPMNWPRMIREFSMGEAALSSYDLLTFNVRIDSDRDEVADDATPVIIGIKAHEGGHERFLGDVNIDLGGVQRSWIPVRVSIRDVIARSGREQSLWKNLKQVQFVITESRYKDGTQLHFGVKDMSLVRITRPVIESVTCPEFCIAGIDQLPVWVDGLGFSADAGGYRLQCRVLQGAAEAARVHTGISLQPAVIDIRRLPPGAYSVEAAIINDRGASVSVMTRNFEIMEK